MVEETRRAAGGHPGGLRGYLAGQAAALNNGRKAFLARQKERFAARWEAIKEQQRRAEEKGQEAEAKQGQEKKSWVDRIKAMQRSKPPDKEGGPDRGR